MREYIRPTMQGEMFAANEYVAACWGVSCDTVSSNEVERHFYDDPIEAQVTHNPLFCGQRTHQAIIDSNNDGIAEGMYEINTDGLTDLVCIRYTDATYEQSASFSDVHPGDVIYWTTSAGNKTWHHQGTVEGKYPGHPNRS